MLESQDNQPEDNIQSEETITRVTGMYKDWFLDYASYVILERAVPAIEDGFKPVQRRILHSMKDLDDGRYNKFANIVGHSMQYHPHGDASIADAMVVASGASVRQVGAMADHLREKLKAAGIKGISIEGLENCDWVLIDSGDVIVHLFRPEVRDFYNLEKLWSEALPESVDVTAAQN